MEIALKTSRAMLQTDKHMDSGKNITFTMEVTNLWLILTKDYIYSIALCC